MIKGRELEATHSKEVYRSDSYFEITQLQSFAYQLLAIRSFAPKKIVEIGVGSGATSIYLRSAGYSVTTIDINPNLNPDICCDIAKIPDLGLADDFDLVVCCQVLEHMPFSEFERNVEILAGMGNLYLTLPSYYSYFGVGGIIRLPFIRKSFGLYVKSPFRTKNLDGGVHFWEIDSEPLTRRRNVIDLLKQHYKSVRVEKIPTNPYHLQFFCSN